MKKRNILDKIKTVFFQNEEDTDETDLTQKPNNKSENIDKESTKCGGKITFADLKRKYQKHDFDFKKNIADGEEITDLEAGSAIFENIFTTANILPIKGKWSGSYLVKIIDNAIAENISSDQVGRLITSLLKTDGINIDCILEDIVERDKALDTYEQFIVNRITEREKELLACNEEMSRQIQANLNRIEKEKNFLTKWLEEKELYEKKIAQACNYLGEQDLMTVGLVTKGAAGRQISDGE